ncbi:MAG TPA: sugar transferase [Kineosporiaceae bacterium]|nr:sugar transferase [Kineosporiaceae bacterium]
MDLDLTDGAAERRARSTDSGSLRVVARHATRVTGRATPLVMPLPSSVPALSTGAIPFGDAPTVGSSHWMAGYVSVLVLLDMLALAIGGSFGRLMSIKRQLSGLPYSAVLVMALPAWLIMLVVSRAYEGRSLGLGSEEFRRVGNAAARFTALLAVVVFMFRLEVARGLVVIALPAMAMFALLFRYMARQVLHRVRADGAASHRVLVVGEGRSRDLLAARLQASPHSGLRVVGVCRPVMDDDVTDPSSLAHVRRAVSSVGADTVAVAHSPGITPEVLRRMAWTLEGTGVDLLVAPALTDVAGPRIHVRPVSGLPLLQIAEPELTGARRVAKVAIDAVGALGMVLLLSPLLIGAAVAVRLSSPGSILFKQTRVGRDGELFGMYKFRSMFADAEARLGEMQALNDHEHGVLFKMQNDPRITRVGKLLRRYSIDELPQLLNVLRGQMSLVGPRPPLPSEVAQYEQDVHRRLMVKPGMTGLWQVSGRSDLDWEETVRLDLYYVENWSVALDGEILWKTFSAVLHGSGAR